MAVLNQLKNLAAAVVRMEHPDSEQAILKLIDELNEWLEGQPELKRTFAIWIRAVLLKRNKEAWALPKVDDLKELRMGLAEQVERWAKAHEQRGRQDGIEEGIQQGLQKGLRQGMQKGSQQAQILILQRQLTRRFGHLPPQALARIQTAAPEQIEVWLDRVLDAGSLEEVLE